MVSKLLEPLILPSASTKIKGMSLVLLIIFKGNSEIFWSNSSMLTVLNSLIASP